MEAGWLKMLHGGVGVLQKLLQFTRFGYALCWMFDAIDRSRCTKHSVDDEVQLIEKNILQVYIVFRFNCYTQSKDDQVLFIKLKSRVP